MFIGSAINKFKISSTFSKNILKSPIGDLYSDNIYTFKNLLFNFMAHIEFNNKLTKGELIF